MVGKIVAKRYVLLEELGPREGGVGFLAYDMNRLSRVEVVVARKADGQLDPDRYEVKEGEAGTAKGGAASEPSSKVLPGGPMAGVVGDGKGADAGLKTIPISTAMLKTAEAGPGSGTGSGATRGKTSRPASSGAKTMPLYVADFQETEPTPGVDEAKQTTPVGSASTPGPGASGVKAGASPAAPSAAATLELAKRTLKVPVRHVPGASEGPTSPGPSGSGSDRPAVAPAASEAEPTPTSLAARGSAPKPSVDKPLPASPGVDRKPGKVGPIEGGPASLLRPGVEKPSPVSPAAPARPPGPHHPSTAPSGNTEPGLARAVPASDKLTASTRPASVSPTVSPRPSEPAAKPEGTARPGSAAASKGPLASSSPSAKALPSLPGALPKAGPPAKVPAGPPPEKSATLPEALGRAFGTGEPPMPRDPTQPLDLAQAEEVEAPVTIEPSKTRPKPMGKGRPETRRIEAAWFAMGEGMDEMEEEPEQPGSMDAAHLWRQANELSPDAYRKFSLDLPPPSLPSASPPGTPSATPPGSLPESEAPGPAPVTTRPAVPPPPPRPEPRLPTGPPVTAVSGEINSHDEPPQSAQGPEPVSSTVLAQGPGPSAGPGGASLGLVSTVSGVQPRVPWPDAATAQASPSEPVPLAPGATGYAPASSGLEALAPGFGPASTMTSVDNDLPLGWWVRLRRKPVVGWAVGTRPGTFMLGFVVGALLMALASC